MKYRVSGLLCRQLVRVGVMNLHSKTSCTLRYRLADTPHPENPEVLARHLPAEKGLCAWDRPLAASDLLLCFECSPTGSEKQEHRDISRCIRHLSRRVSNRDVALRSRAHVDVIDAHRVG